MSTMTVKVYCRDCKWYNGLVDHEDYESCDHPENMVSSYKEKNVYRRNTPQKLNKFNRCRMFERRIGFWEHVLWFFYRLLK